VKLAAIFKTLVVQLFNDIFTAKKLYIALCNEILQQTVCPLLNEISGKLIILHTVLKVIACSIYNICDKFSLYWTAIIGEFAFTKFSFTSLKTC
jgi:hypothetical protein